MPVVTTLHTVLREPDANQRIVMDEIAALSDRLIVMSEHSSRLLQEVFGVPEIKIDVIPHGVPDLPFGDPNYYKDSSGNRRQGPCCSHSDCCRRTKGLNA